MARDDYFTKESSNGGAPKLILNKLGKETIQKLSSLMCTDEEIATHLEVSIETLQNDNNIDAFSEFKKKGQNQGRSSLRKWQFEAAKKGKVPMLIFLGKNYLGQKDSVELTDNKEINDQIKNIADLINKPKKVRTEKDVGADTDELL